MSKRDKRRLATALVENFEELFAVESADEGSANAKTTEPDRPDQLNTEIGSFAPSKLVATETSVSRDNIRIFEEKTAKELAGAAGANRNRVLLRDKSKTSEGGDVLRPSRRQSMWPRDSAHPLRKD